MENPTAEAFTERLKEHASAEQRTKYERAFRSRPGDRRDEHHGQAGAPFLIGGYLFDRPRDLLYQLARSDSPRERRAALMATMYFVRQGDLDDTFAIAELLLDDEHDLVHKPVGGMLREAGKRDRPRLLRFLDEHAAAMPRTTLRYAIEHLDPEQRDRYLGR